MSSQVAELLDLIHSIGYPRSRPRARKPGKVIADRAAPAAYGPGPTLVDVFAREPGWRAETERILRDVPIVARSCRRGHPILFDTDLTPIGCAVCVREGRRRSSVRARRRASRRRTDRASVR